MMEKLFRDMAAGLSQDRAAQTRAGWFSVWTALCLLGAACSPATPAIAPGAAPTEAWVDVNLNLGPGALDFTEMQSGLDGLSGYKAILKETFDGTEAGAKSQWSQTYEMLRGTKPDAWQLTVTHSDPATPPEFSAVTDGVYYQVGDKGQCTGYSIDPQQPPERPEPADLLTGVLGAEAAGHETLAGVKADHYTFDERALAQDGLTHSKGELWLASEGGYLLRYVLKTQADERYFGKGTQGTVTWDYQMSDVNAPVALTLPPDCPPGMIDAPKPDDAANVLSVPGYLEFTTAANVADTFKFYEAKLAALGWKEYVVDASTLPGFEGLNVTEEELKALGLGSGPQEQITDETGALKAYILNDRILTLHIEKREGVTYATLQLDRKTQ